MTIREQAGQVVKKCIQCQCPEEYKSRGLFGPTCPWHEHAEDLIDEIEAALREQWQEAVDFVRRADWVVSNSQQREAMSDALMAKAHEQKRSA